MEINIHKGVRCGDFNHLVVMLKKRFEVSSLFGQVDIPTGLYSDRPLFRQLVIIPSVRPNEDQANLFILYLHSDFIQPN